MKSQLEKIAQACHEARLAHIPIVYLLSDEWELADELLSGGRLVPLMNYSPKESAFRAIDDLFDADTRLPEEQRRYRSLRSIEIQNVRVVTSIPDRLFYNCNMPDTEELPKEGLHFQESPQGGRLAASADDLALTVGPQITLVKNFSHGDPNLKQLNRYVHCYLNARPEDGIRKSLLILMSPVLTIPEGLESYVEVVNVPHLEEWEIENVIVGFMRDVSGEKRPHKEYLDRMTVSLKGFGRRKIVEILNRIFTRMGGIARNTAGDLPPEEIVDRIIWQEKQQMLQKSGNLRGREPRRTAGGLDRLKAWVDRQRPIFCNTKPAADAWRINPPKGVLIAGIPGTGKSLMAEEIARRFGVTLIQMDMGAVMDRYVGQTEANMRRILALIEALSPCVLWIDEIEKAFASTKSSADNDGGTLKRAFATFLTWMQDKRAPCFVVATANSIQALPPELLRRGRFDQKFFTFMPTRQECADIFRMNIRALQTTVDGKCCKLYDEEILSDAFLDRLLRYCGSRNKFLTGADIDGIVNDAKSEIFRSNFGTVRPEAVKYRAGEFFRALCQAVDESCTYGETNLDDIARSFIDLRKNRFLPASSNHIITFDEFDPAGEEAVAGSFRGEENGYDERLFELLKSRINRIWQQEKEAKNVQSC